MKPPPGKITKKKPFPVFLFGKEEKKRSLVLILKTLMLREMVQCIVYPVMPDEDINPFKKQCRNDPSSLKFLTVSAINVRYIFRLTNVVI